MIDKTIPISGRSISKKTSAILKKIYNSLWKNLSVKKKDVTKLLLLKNLNNSIEKNIVQK